MEGRQRADSRPAIRTIISHLMESMKKGVPGVPLNNAACRFNRAGGGRSPFRTVGKTSYEAETGELQRLREGLDRKDVQRYVILPMDRKQRAPRRWPWLAH